MKCAEVVEVATICTAEVAGLHGEAASDQQPGRPRAAAPRRAARRAIGAPASTSTAVSASGSAALGAAIPPCGHCGEVKRR